MERRREDEEMELEGRCRDGRMINRWKKRGGRRRMMKRWKRRKDE